MTHPTQSPKKLLARATLFSAIALLAGCAAIVAVPTNENSKPIDPVITQTDDGAKCVINGEHTQDLSDGTTKATLTQTCEQSSLFIENQHPEHAKRCKLVMAGNGAELYIRPGENRTISQNGPVPHTQIALACVNDWNRPR